MAEYGEWGRKGATLSEATAQKEFGVSRKFIINGIQSGALEYRQSVIWGNPIIRVLRSQLEKYIAKEHGANKVTDGKNQTELRKIKKEVTTLKMRLAVLQERQMQLEAQVKSRLK